jgi:hypothetical protein
LKKDCFSDCKRLKVVTFAPDSKFESIGKYVFSGCLSLLSIRLPSSVIKLKAGCFLGCKSLEVVTFETNSKLEFIGENVFVECEALRLMVLPSSLLYVEINCFSGCNSLFQLEFTAPSHLSKLYDLPPVWNEGLNEIPDSVEVLHLPKTIQPRPGYAVGFGRDSKLARCDMWPPWEEGTISMFLQLSSGTLKTFRSSLEFC